MFSFLIRKVVITVNVKREQSEDTPCILQTYMYEIGTIDIDVGIIFHAALNKRKHCGFIGKLFSIQSPPATAAADCSFRQLYQL